MTNEYHIVFAPIDRGARLKERLSKVGIDTTGKTGSIMMGTNRLSWNTRSNNKEIDQMDDKPSIFTRGVNGERRHCSRNHLLSKMSEANSGEFIVFTKPGCGVCARAYEHKDLQSASFQLVGESIIQTFVKNKFGHNTFPIIFLGAQLIGGLSEFEKYIATKKR